MWPWGHLAVGYACYSLVARTLHGHSPRGGPTLAAIIGTQLPDLIDKPLSWSLSVLHTGYGPGHSIFVALPLITAAVVATEYWGRRQYGIAVGVGYLTHLLGDIAYAVVVGSDVVVGRVVWPFGPAGEATPTDSFIERFLEYFLPFLDALLSGDATGVLVVYTVLFTGVFALWVYDGYPIARELLEYLIIDDDPNSLS